MASVASEAKPPENLGENVVHYFESHFTNWGFRPQNRSHAQNSLDICVHRGTNVLLMSILRSRLRSDSRWSSEQDDDDDEPAMVAQLAWYWLAVVRTSE